MNPAKTGLHKHPRTSFTRESTLVAGNGTLGFSGDSGTAIDAQLSEPQGVAVDPGENL